MFNRFFFENPEIIRHLRTQFRYPRVLSFIILYLISILCFYSLLYFVMTIDNIKFFDLKNYSLIIYATTLAIEYMIYFFIGTYLISNSLSLEKEKETFDFIRLTIIDRKIIAIGKLFGAPLFLTFLLLITFPFVSISAWIAGVPAGHFIIVHFNLFLYGIFFHTLGLFCAVNVAKHSSANAIALSLPFIIITTTLTMEIRNVNPFMILFSVLNKTGFVNHNLLFFGFSIPDFILSGIIIFYLVVWFLIALIRKLDTETNHTLSKKQSILFVFGLEIIILGLFWEYLSLGNNNLITIFFIINLFLMGIIIAIITPTREDILTYLNKKEEVKNNFWEAKSPIYSIIIVLNIIIGLFGFIASFLSFNGNNIAELSLFTLSLSILLSMFSIIYSQIFYLSNISYLKNASSITMAIITLSFFIPLPLNFITSGKKEFFNLLIFNPFVAFFKISEETFLSLGNLLQVLILLIVILTLNFLILSAQEKAFNKFKL